MLKLRVQIPDIGKEYDVTDRILDDIESKKKEGE